MILIDCNKLPVVEDRLYGGATGSKIAVRYNNSVWMLKCSQTLKNRELHNVEISYANDPITEYIGSHIYSIFGIPVQDTLLGKYKNKMCVLCSDDAYPNRLYEFREFRNTIFDQDVQQHSSGMSTSLDDILDVIQISDRINTEAALERFWLMFVLDSLIGNTDRNNGNWAFVYKDNKFELYEVYDCGGCLNNKRSDGQMLNDLETNRVMNLAINYTFNYKDKSGKRINPFHYIEKYRNIYMDKALKLFKPELLSEINNLIDSLCDIISDTQKTWYKEIIKARFDKLLGLKNSSADQMHLF